MWGSSLTAKDRRQPEVCRFHGPRTRASSQSSVDLLVALRSQTSGPNHS